MHLGSEIVRLRQQRHCDLETCAERAGITRRALAYIETGDRLPKAQTLEQILSALGASDAEADRLRRIRDEEQAQRDGLSVAKRDEHQIPRLTRSIVGETAWYLKQRGVTMKHRDYQKLRVRLDKVVRAVLDPDSVQT